VGMALILVVPALARRARLPAVVALLLSGVVVGPHVLSVGSPDVASLTIPDEDHGGGRRVAT